MINVARDVFCLQQSLVNVIFLGPRGAGDRQWILVDAGVAFSAGQIRAVAARLFGPHSRPGAIVLTHGHFDHVGGLPALADQWDVPVFAHKMELPYLTGQANYPPPDPAVGGGLMSLSAYLYPSHPLHLGRRVHPLPGDHSIPYMLAWRWVATPGHTPGHISLFREEDATLVAGDAFVTVKQESLLAIWLQHAEVRRPPAYFTPDWEAARASVARLVDLEPQAAITGHGPPMYGAPLQSQLRRLLEAWDTVAIPAYGRYVKEPAIADERGPVWTPPPVVNRQLMALAALGLAGVAGLAAVRQLRSAASGP